MTLLAALAVPAWAGSANPPSRVAQPRTSRSPAARTTVYSNQADSPPGVLSFDAHEIDRQMSGYIGTIADIYAATLPSGVKGHLVLVMVPDFHYPIGVVQPDDGRFTLHKGERVVVLRSPENAWMRVLPYNGPESSSRRQ